MLILIEDWILHCEEWLELVSKQEDHGSTVEGQHRCEVTSVELKETLVEYSWVWLTSDKI